MQNKCSRTAFPVFDFRDDTLAKKIETDLRVDAFMGDSIDFFEMFKFREDVFFNPRLVNAAILAVRR